MASYTALLNTPNVLPHITIQSGLSKEKAVEVAKRFKKHDKPFFSPSGWPKISKTTMKSTNLDFYAVEQPLNTNGIFVEDIHISLAYAINRPITQMELAMAPYTDRFYPSDFDVVVANCSDEDPNKWYILDDIV